LPALLLLCLALALGCAAPAGRAAPENPYGLVWQAWGEIRRSYPGSPMLDRDSLVGSAIAALPGLEESPPYPFLTQVGRLRGQPPAGVPPELADLWRALTLHQRTWPAYTAEELAQAAITGLVAGLEDPGAAYYTAQEYPQARQSLEGGFPGSYQGIGAEVDAADGLLRLFPQEGSPAAAAGLQAGDMVVGVDGRSIEGMTPGQVIGWVRGPAGTSVVLTIRRPGQPETLEYQVVRGEITVPSVAHQMTPGDIAYLNIQALRDDTGRQTAQALEDLARQPVEGVILDLRAIPAGSTAAALEVAGRFLPPGALVMYEVDGEGRRRDWKSPGESGPQGALPPTVIDPLPVPGQTLHAAPDFRQAPLAVVVDENTRGAAELAAAALQDAGRGRVFGMATPGQAAGYAFRELADGSALYLPEGVWYTPSGRRVTGAGVRPDEEVPYQVQNNWFGESQLNQAYQYLDARRPVAR
jgi:carboxyl-terminal processing protease